MVSQDGEAGYRKVVMITGAAGMLGTALSRRWADTYDLVAVCHRKAPQVATNRRSFLDPLDPGADLPDNAHPAFEIHADLTDDKEIARVVDLALARYGRIDVLVNAIGQRGRSGLLKGHFDSAPAAFKVNALVPIEMAVHIAKRFWRHHDLDNVLHHRLVVNVSASAAVDTGDDSLGTVVAASKAALNILSAHLADELRAFNVRVNTVAPAPFPSVVALDHLVSAITDMIDGEDTGRLLLLWGDADELV
jgi:NAD(P)-dependent dehydrogenase (short-subunit alcohol dehydrogenase family)